MTNEQFIPWQRLKGKIADSVLHAPKTSNTGGNNEGWSEIPEQVVQYLEARTLATPWANHLALLAAVLATHELSDITIMSFLWVLHPRFRALFHSLGLQTMDEWDVEQYMPAYLTGKVLPQDSQPTRLAFWRQYNSASRHMRDWLESLPLTDRKVYQPFVLPVVELRDVPILIGKPKVETPIEIQHFATIRAQAHLRYNRLARLRQAYREAASLLQEGSSLPITFTYEEGADSEQGIPPQERLYFRIWDRPSFVVAHQDRFSPSMVSSAQKGLGSFAKERHSLFLEFVRSEQLIDKTPSEGFWFLELLKRDVLGHRALWGARAIFTAKQNWLRDWGYGEEGTNARIAPFRADVPGLLDWQGLDDTIRFTSKAQQAARGILVPIESLYTTTTFGLLATDLCTTTGMSPQRAQQIRLTEDCIVRLEMPVPPDSRDQTARSRYIVRLMSEDNRIEAPINYLIGQETVRLLARVDMMLCEHYELKKEERLPIVPFDASHRRNDRFCEASYLFQYNHRHLSDQAIAACMRFLLHGLEFTTSDEKSVVLKYNQFHQVLAGYAPQSDKSSLDIIGTWLNQQSDTATDSQHKRDVSSVSDEADRYLSNFVTHIDVQEAVRQSSEELRNSYEEMRRTVSILSDAIGGMYVNDRYCADKFVSIGCAGKVLDPSRRYQVERYRQWALGELEFATQEGLLTVAEQMRQLVRECEIELGYMDQIEDYQRDEARTAQIRIESAA